MTADTNSILQELREEKTRIENAIAALEGGPGKSTNGRRTANGRRRGGRKGRTLSAAARKKISQAAKARWAAAKRAGRNAL